MVTPGAAQLLAGGAVSRACFEQDEREPLTLGRLQPLAGGAVVRTGKYNLKGEERALPVTFGRGLPSPEALHNRLLRDVHGVGAWEPNDPRDGVRRSGGSSPLMESLPYSDLFGWEFDTPSPVAQEVSEPESYGFLDLMTSEDGTGIRGGVGGGLRYESHGLLRRRRGCRGCVAASREPRRHPSDGSGDTPERPCRRSLQDPEGTLIGVAGVA
jgi:uncharacterized protein